MEKTEAFRLITRQLRRGVVLFRVLWLASIGLAGLALVTPGYRSLAIAGFLLAVLFVLGMLYMGEKYLSAWRACENPLTVYWAHPTTRGGHLLEQPTDKCTRLVLHLRDGMQCEVGLPAPEMRKFIAWLAERNQLVRWGAYDKPEATKIEAV